MEQLIKSLPSVLRESESPEVTEAACFAAWNYTVGEGLRVHAVPTALVERKLIVAVRDAIWQRQLQTMLGQLVYRVNQVLGDQVVSGIEISVQPEALPAPARVSKRRTGEFPAELVSAAEGIHDPKLREAFLGAAESCLERLERNQEEES